MAAGEKASAIIDDALEKLMLREKDEHPWVVFTDSSSAHFVQFGFEKGALFIDVPLAERTDEEKKKLEQLFGRIGVKRPVVMQARDPKTLKAFTSYSYQADFSRETRRASVFALRVFIEVFRIEAPSIAVEVGSG